MTIVITKWKNPEYPYYKKILDSQDAAREYIKNRVDNVYTASNISEMLLCEGNLDMYCVLETQIVNVLRPVHAWMVKEGTTPEQLAAVGWTLIKE